MAKRGKKLADDVVAHDLEAVQAGLLADEDAYDRRTPWRLASWGLGAMGAVTIAVLANQSYVHKQQDRVAAADLARQTEQIKPSHETAATISGGFPRRSTPSTATATVSMLGQRRSSRGLNR